MSWKSGFGWVAALGLLGCAPPRCPEHATSGASPTGDGSVRTMPEPGGRGTEAVAGQLVLPPVEVAEVRGVLGQFVEALRARDEGAVRTLADPVEGLWFWAAPGCCVAPVFALGREPGTDLDLADPELSPKSLSLFGDQARLHDGYFDSLAVTLADALPVAAVYCGRYELPPEELLEAAPPWAGLCSGEFASLRLFQAATSTVGGPLSTLLYAQVQQAPIAYVFDGSSGWRWVRVVLTRRAGELRLLHVEQAVYYDA